MTFGIKSRWFPGAARARAGHGTGVGGVGDRHDSGHDHDLAARRAGQEPGNEQAGLLGIRVDKAGDLEDALRQAFGHDGPALVEVRTARLELSLPPKLTYGQIKGFTLYATRTILSGGGAELVELTRTNLRELEAE